MPIRITGIDTPFGGISWEICASEKEKAKKMIDILSGRRILSNTCKEGCNNCKEYSSKSLLKIRDILDSQLSIAQDDDYKGCLRKMRQICNNSLNDFNDPLCQKLLLYTSQTNNKTLCPIIKFRNDFVFYIEIVVSMFKVPMNEDIDSMFLNRGYTINDREGFSTSKFF